MPPRMARRQSQKICHVMIDSALILAGAGCCISPDDSTSFNSRPLVEVPVGLDQCTKLIDSLA